MTKAESGGEGGESVCSQPALLAPTDDYVNVEHESGAQAVVAKRYDIERSILYHRWQRLEDTHTPASGTQPQSRLPRHFPLP